MRTTLKTNTLRSLLAIGSMALAGLGGLDVAIGRHLEALLGARLRLHLGHFARFRVFGDPLTGSR